MLSSSVCAALPEEDGLIQVRMAGEAEGTGTDARLEAIRNAEREMVTQVLELGLCPEVLLKLSTLIDKFSDYIQSTECISVKKDDGYTQVEIKSYVQRKRLLEDASTILLAKTTHPPTVLLLIAEKNATAEETARAGIAETTLGLLLAEAGLDLLDREAMHTGVGEAALLQAIQGDLEAEKRLARQTLAQAVVLGQAVTKIERPASSANLLKNIANVTLRVYRSADGKLIESFGAEAAIHSQDPKEGGRAAIENACHKLKKDLALYVAMAAVSSPPSSDVTITIEHPESRARFESLVAKLGLLGDGDVDELFFSERLARVRMPYFGSLAALVDTLAAGKYEGRALEVRRALERNMTVRFK